MDDVFRHAITKMSHLHLVAAPAYRRRVIQMGEQPGHVHVVGALGLENFKRLKLPDIGQLSGDLGFDLSGRYVLVTYHPATLEDRLPVLVVDEMIAALETLKDVKILATKANADPGGRVINARLEAWAGASPSLVKLVDNLGQVRYLAALCGAAAVVGNSSSGLIEAPAVDVPTVNIGSRQNGRLMADSIIQAADDRGSIVSALHRALDPKFRDGLRQISPPYGRPVEIARSIVSIVKEADLSKLLKKTFYDLEERGRHVD